MKRFHPFLSLAATTYLLFTFSCSKIPPQYACNTPVKRVTVYDTATGIISFVRHYTYTSQLQVDSIIDTENSHHPTVPTIYVMQYNVQHQLTNVQFSGPGGVYNIQYNYANGNISGIASPLFVATNYAYSFIRNIPWYNGSTPTLLVSNGHSKLREIAWFMNANTPANADSIITSSRYQNSVQESRYYYTYSQQLNPEYEAFRAGWFYAYSINQHFPLQSDPAATSLHLPASSSNLLWSMPPSSITTYSFVKDHCGRVIKVYAQQNGATRLWKSYQYY
ncbi:hypothetical protein [Chitinophaga eiseniae]|uniref:Uncharacterized protein n=1 Tax=Chitinophaga eiseniae TaxID=634771 RepID=A0A847SKF4_9BACT|nr:hypothetical protein [Chitinophaga eiseniae]NLR80263.1 hypothetical protein [Chitinophaga eiseniae]